MKDKVEIEIEYPFPVDRVWQALTDPQALDRWLMPTNFRPLIGYRFRFEKPDGGKVSGKVTDVEERRLLAYTWEDDEDGGESMVAWLLDPTDDGTRVTLVHSPIGRPEVTCLAPETYFNWLQALSRTMPGLLRILQATTGRVPRPPIVYVAEAKEEVQA